VRSLAEELSRKKFTVPLKTATFDRAATNLHYFKKISRNSDERVYLPSCVTCPDRTGNAADLFNQFDDPDVCTNSTCFEQKTQCHHDNKRREAEASGAKIISGDAALKIIPRKDTIVGFVNLDDACDFMDYDADVERSPEPDETEDYTSPTFQARRDAWEERAVAWQPPTYRKLLADAPITPTLVEDPKSKTLLELAPVAVVRERLKTKDITLPSYIGAKPHDHSAPSSSGRAYGSLDWKEQQAREQERQERERKYRSAVLAACHAAWKGPLKREDLVNIADQLLERYGVRVTLEPLYGNKFPLPGQMKEAELPRLIVLALVADCCRQVHIGPQSLLALAKRLKVNVDKIKKEQLTANKAEAAAPAKTAAKGKAKVPKASAKKGGVK
jgi:hypothetical protein